MTASEFDPKRFDFTDLWRQTTGLAAGLNDGVYVSGFWGSGNEVKANLGWDVADKMKRVRLENATLTATAEENTLLTGQICRAMGSPRYTPVQDGIMTYDRAPDRSLFPDVQLEVAQLFLSHFSRIVVDTSLIPGSRPSLLVVEKSAASTRDNVLRLARINYGLANLLSHEIEGYKDIVKRAEVWVPSANSPFGWL